MTLKNARAPLLCCFKLCASFHSHRWIQTKVTVRKRSIRVKIGDLLSPVTLKFDRWPWKIIEHLFYVASIFMHHFIAIGEFKLKLQSGNAQFGSKSMLFLAVWWTSLLSLVITAENFMMIRWQEHCEKGVTDGQTEIAVLRAAWSQQKSSSETPMNVRYLWKS